MKVRFDCYHDLRYFTSDKTSKTQKNNVINNALLK